jgi:sugar lactone lactonase YvrE
MNASRFLGPSLATLTLLVGCLSVLAQDQNQPNHVGGVVDYPTGGDVRLYDGHIPQTRLQMRDLGIAPFDVIPAGQTAITSLAVARDGKIYGGTTGYKANLFVFSPGHNIVFPLGTVPNEESIYHSLVVSSNNSIYFGTTRNVDRNYHPGEEFARGTDSYYKSVTVQILQDFQAYPGGHLYRYDPTSTKISFLQEDFRIDKPAALIDLGIPVPHEGIYTLLLDEKGKALYGISFPGGHLFKHDIDTGKSTVLAALNQITPMERYLPVISKVLVEDKAGRIYANSDYGYLVRYDPLKGTLETLNVRLPGLSGRELFNGIDAAVLHPDGQIYGGTTDGFLFVFNPDSAEMINLGKPLIEPCIRALTVGNDGNIYGIGGKRDNGIARLFVYNPSTRSFADLGMIEVAWLPYSEWKGFLFDSMVTGLDGSLFLGNSEHRSRLFIYNP